jgi:hypothetical protein
MQRAFQTALLILALAAVGCSEDNPRVGRAAIASRSDNDFTNLVLPVMLRDCGFQACHGSSERFFRVFGPGRTRIDDGKTRCLDSDGAPPCPYDQVSGTERDTSWYLAESMIDPVHPANSLLLTKPLAVAAGGADHEGVDKYGRNVYRTPDDDGYKTIARWVLYEAPRMAAGVTTPPVTVTAGTGGGAAGAPGFSFTQ